MITFTVYGVPEPQGSTKNLPDGRALAAIRRGGLHIRTVADLMRAVHITSDNPDLKSWRSRVAFEATLALRGVSLLLGGGVDVRVDFYLPRPSGLAKKYAGPHLKKPDLDKLIRAVGDALSDVLWKDDAQVGHIDGWKHYAALGEQPRAVITVSALPVTTAIPLLDTDPRKDTNR